MVRGSSPWWPTKKRRSSALHKYRGIAQLVEQRSPKPRAEGSSPSAPAKTKKTPAGVFLFWLGLNNSNTRHAERVEGCGSPVETSARSAEAPTEPAGETKSFCPCQKETVTILVTVSFLLDKTCPRHARAGASRRAAAGGRCSEARMAQRSKFIAAPRRNKFWESLNYS